MDTRGRTQSRQCEQETGQPQAEMAHHARSICRIRGVAHAESAGTRAAQQTEDI
jgi:hypothetical protein